MCSTLYKGITSEPEKLVATVTSKYDDIIDDVIKIFSLKIFLTSIRIKWNQPEVDTSYIAEVIRKRKSYLHIILLSLDIVSPGNLVVCDGSQTKEVCIFLKYFQLNLLKIVFFGSNEYWHSIFYQKN